MLDKKKIFKNIFSNWMSFAVNVVISFFLAPFIVHSLGNIYYGIWIILMQFTGYLYIMDFGVRESIIRYVSKYEAKKDKTDLNEVLSSGLILYSAIGFASLIIAIVLSIVFPYVFSTSSGDLTTIRIAVVLSGITIMQFLAFNVYMGVLFGLQRYDISNIIAISAALIRLPLILYFLSEGYGLVALASIQLFVGLGSSIFIYIYAHKLLEKHGMPFKFVQKPFKERFPIFKKLYHYSVFVLINNLGQKAIFSTDALIIGIFLSAPFVTFYAIGATLVTYLRKFILRSNSVLNPVASELEAKTDKVGVGRLVLNSSRLSVLIALPICVVFLTLGSDFIRVWMGEEYTEFSPTVLYVLTISTLLSVPHNSVNMILYGISKHKIVAYLRVLEAIFNLILSVVLVNLIGILGVALGTAIPHIIFMVIALPIVIQKHISFSGYRYLTDVYIKPLIAAIPFALSGIYISKNYAAESLIVFFGQVTSILPIYMLFAYMLCLKKEEKKLVTSIVKRYFPVKRFAE
jgi:O-antigen/teichoic acid export membrane protein